jgi:hypothetical protein
MEFAGRRSQSSPAALRVNNLIHGALNFHNFARRKGNELFQLFESDYDIIVINDMLCGQGRLQYMAH